MPLPAEDRPPVEHDVHTDELPALPQRDSRIPVARWPEAPAAIRDLGADIGAEPGYLRRIGRYLLWRRRAGGEGRRPLRSGGRRRPRRGVDVPPVRRRNG